MFDLVWVAKCGRRCHSESLPATAADDLREVPLRSPKYSGAVFRARIILPQMIARILATFAQA